MLKVENVSVRYNNHLTLNNLSLEVNDGEILAVVGPSGSGKSTLLRVIAGLIIPESGKILIDGKDISKVPTHKRNIGMVFQDNQLFPHMNVQKNIEYGLRSQQVSASSRKSRAKEMLDLVGLSGFEERRVDDLSGGESKRVALARSLTPQPAILLLDEPLTGLDATLHDQLMVELSELLRETKTTAILVTHDKNEADQISDRIFKLTE